MSDSQYCAISEFLTYNSLYNAIVFNIDIGCGLVYQHNFAVLEKSSANTEQLFLSCRQTVIGY